MGGEGKVDIKTNGHVHISYPIAGLIGLAVFLASLFGGWITQTKDISSAQTRITNLEKASSGYDTYIAVHNETHKNLCLQLGVMQQLLKDIQDNQLAYYKSRGWKGNGQNNKEEKK